MITTFQMAWVANLHWITASYFASHVIATRQLSEMFLPSPRQSASVTNISESKLHAKRLRRAALKSRSLNEPLLAPYSEDK